MAELDRLLAASESDCSLLASRCPHPFRPARQIRDIFRAGQTEAERAYAVRLDPTVTAVPRIM